MKTTLAIVAMFLISAVSTMASARDDITRVTLAEVLAMPEAKERLDGSVKFYLDGQQTPEIIEKMQSGVSNQKTNSVGKSKAFACKWVTLSALIRFQTSAKQRGANAVVDLVSYYKRNTSSNPKTIECHDGAFVSGVALKGNYAKVAN